MPKLYLKLTYFPNFEKGLYFAIYLPNLFIFEKTEADRPTFHAQIIFNNCLNAFNYSSDVILALLAKKYHFFNSARFFLKIDHCAPICRTEKFRKKNPAPSSICMDASSIAKSKKISPWHLPCSYRIWLRLPMFAFCMIEKWVHGGEKLKITD